MKTALIIIFLVISVILAVIVMMQEGKGGLSGAISGGGADTYWSKNKGKSKESVLKNKIKIDSLKFKIQVVQ